MSHEAMICKMLTVTVAKNKSLDLQVFITDMTAMLLQYIVTHLPKK